MEALDRFDEAIADYKAVLAAAPDDPAAFNNLASLGRGPRRRCAAEAAAAGRGAPGFRHAQKLWGS